MNHAKLQTLDSDSAGVVSWVHFGDLHMQLAEDQHYRDLVALVMKVNADFAEQISFVMLPGDNANEGSKKQYELVRSALDQLDVPWCAIIGDHDVHEKSFDNFLEYLQPATHYSFTVGDLHFFALNAFSTPRPDSFELSSEQLDWLQAGLERMRHESHAVLFLHCYPSELIDGGDRLRKLIKGPRVLMIDMGHTHYNEVANDGDTIYSATRSTGQIEEGPVGFSVTNIDGNAVSWKFSPLSESSLVMITSPADYRLTTSSSAPLSNGAPLTIRAKVWGASPQTQMQADIGGQKLALSRIQGSNVFQGALAQSGQAGVYELVVTAFGDGQKTIHDKILVRLGEMRDRPRPPHDLENALEPWPEHGLLGTRLGPNRNGRKW